MSFQLNEHAATRPGDSQHWTERWKHCLRCKNAIDMSVPAVHYQRQNRTPPLAGLPERRDVGFPEKETRAATVTNNREVQGFSGPHFHSRKDKYS